MDSSIRPHANKGMFLVASEVRMTMANRTTRTLFYFPLILISFNIFFPLMLEKYLKTRVTVL